MLTTFMSENCEHEQWKFVCRDCGEEIPEEMIGEWRKKVSEKVTKGVFELIKGK